MATLLIACGVQEFPHQTPARAVELDQDQNEPLLLDGEEVEKDDAIAFLHFGHSNMAGKAKGPAPLRPYFFDEVDPRAWTFHVSDGMRPALEPFTAGSLERGMYAGPGTALMKLAAARAPDRHFISLGFGQGSAYCLQFLPGSLYYESVMAGALALKGRVTFGALIIMLGVTERHGRDEDIDQYSDCIAQLVDAIRDDLGEPDLPLLLSDYERESWGKFGVNEPIARAIIPEIAKVPDKVHRSVIIPTDGIAMQDNHHFNMEGHLTWSTRVLDLMQEHGWSPWTPADPSEEPLEP